MLRYGIAIALALLTLLYIVSIEVPPLTFTASPEEIVVLEPRISVEIPQNEYVSVKFFDRVGLERGSDIPTYIPLKIVGKPPKYIKLISTYSYNDSSWLFPKSCIRVNAIYRYEVIDDKRIKVWIGIEGGESREKLIDISRSSTYSLILFSSQNVFTYRGKALLPLPRSIYIHKLSRSGSLLEALFLSIPIPSDLDRAGELRAALCIDPYLRFMILENSSKSIKGVLLFQGIEGIYPELASLHILKVDICEKLREFSNRSSIYRDSCIYEFVEFVNKSLSYYQRLCNEIYRNVVVRIVEGVHRGKYVKPIESDVYSTGPRGIDIVPKVMRGIMKSITTHPPVIISISVPLSDIVKTLIDAIQREAVYGSIDLGSYASKRCRDSVTLFLLYARRGVCIHFASALARALQLLGINSGIALGLSYEESSDGYALYALHAWTEISVEDELHQIYAYVDVDPTPPPRYPIPSSRPVAVRHRVYIGSSEVFPYVSVELRRSTELYPFEAFYSWAETIGKIVFRDDIVFKAIVIALALFIVFMSRRTRLLLSLIWIRLYLSIAKPDRYPSILRYTVSQLYTYLGLSMDRSATPREALAKLSEVIGIDAVDSVLSVYEEWRYAKKRDSGAVKKVLAMLIDKAIVLGVSRWRSSI